MSLNITAKNIQLDREVKEYIEKKMEKLSRHLTEMTEAKVELVVENTKAREQRVGVQITLDAGGTLLRGEERGNDFITAIDKTIGIMDRQIERFKAKHHPRKGGISPRKELAEEALETPTSRIVKNKQFDIKPMSSDEAIEQMELLGHNFFLFVNNDTGKISLLYRRKDKNYGIIEARLQ